MKWFICCSVVISRFNHLLILIYLGLCLIIDIVHTQWSVHLDIHQLDTTRQPHTNLFLPDKLLPNDAEKYYSIPLCRIPQTFNRHSLSSPVASASRRCIPAQKENAHIE